MNYKRFKMEDYTYEITACYRIAGVLIAAAFAVAMDLIYRTRIKDE